MEEKVTEKVYCYDHPSAYKQDNSALWALAMNKDKENPLETMALLNGGTNNWNNNPFMYLVWMYMMRWLNGGYGENGGFATAETQRQLTSLQREIQDNHNSDLIMAGINGNTDAIREAATRMGCDINALSSAISNVRAGIDTVAGQIGFTGERVINAVQAGDCGVTQAVKDCCCGTQKEILKMGYENQLANERQTNALSGVMSQNNYQTLDRMRDLGNGIAQGFADVGYATQRQTCDIIQAGNTNTQRIIDVMNNHWQQDLRDKLFEMSQAAQTASIVSQVKAG